MSSTIKIRTRTFRVRSLYWRPNGPVEIDVVQETESDMSDDKTQTSRLSRLILETYRDAVEFRRPAKRTLPRGLTIRFSVEPDRVVFAISRSDRIFPSETEFETVMNHFPRELRVYADAIRRSHRRGTKRSKPNERYLYSIIEFGE